MKFMILFFFAVILVINVHCSGKIPCYSAIYSFGDSLTDTGNLLTSSPKQFYQIGHLPYGRTYFNRPTGRCSDGRLIVDFLAQAFGLQLLPPFLHRNSGFRSGINFAVAGATALNASLFQERHIGPLWTTFSLDTQINWFMNFKNIYCSRRQDCNTHFENALFLMGEIGGNDLNYPFSERRSIDEVAAFVPPIIAKIRGAIETLINEGGAKKFIVPSNLPFGCSPSYLTTHKSSPVDLDEIGCLTEFNNISQYQNGLLQSMLQDLQRNYPKVSIVYADYYSATMKILKNPQNYGMQRNILMVCCGIGGKYNYSPLKGCGSQGVGSCSNPNQYLNWDGVHLTETAYKAIATMFLNGEFTTPPLNTVETTCKNLLMNSKNSSLA